MAGLIGPLMSLCSIERQYAQALFKVQECVPRAEFIDDPIRESLVIHQQVKGNFDRTFGTRREPGSPKSKACNSFNAGQRESYISISCVVTKAIQSSVEAGIVHFRVTCLVAFGPNRVESTSKQVVTGNGKKSLREKLSGSFRFLEDNQLTVSIHLISAGEVTNLNHFANAFSCGLDGETVNVFNYLQPIQVHCQGESTDH